MKAHITFLGLTLASLSALAADITGTWKAEFDTQRGLQKYTFRLKQDGTRVSGQANVERDGEKREADLKEGKIEGDTVIFVEPLKIQDNEIKFSYTGKVLGNEIKFTRKVGDFGSSDATAKREETTSQAEGGWYYLLTAEGGTNWNHAVAMARSRHLTGPYELHPDTYIMTARHRPDAELQRAGHPPAVRISGEKLCVNQAWVSSFESPVG